MATRKKTNTPARTKAKATVRTRKSTPKVVAPTHDAIAERAWCIWKDNGCQPGQDEHNWLEAAAQLKTELVSC
jgi:hypothetical protein